MSETKNISAYNFIRTQNHKKPLVLHFDIDVDFSARNFSLFLLRCFKARYSIVIVDILSIFQQVITVIIIVVLIWISVVLFRFKCQVLHEYFVGD